MKRFTKQTIRVLLTKYRSPLIGIESESAKSIHYWQYPIRNLFILAVFAGIYFKGSAQGCVFPITNFFTYTQIDSTTFVFTDASSGGDGCPGGCAYGAGCGCEGCGSVGDPWVYQFGITGVDVPYDTGIVISYPQTSFTCTLPSNGTYNVCESVDIISHAICTCPNLPQSMENSLNSDGAYYNNGEYCVTINTCGIHANFTYTPKALTVNFSDASFTNGSTITGWNWTFGDTSGGTATGPTPSYTYAKSGTYNVCLTITTSTGCIDTFCQSITVTACPANFTYDVNCLQATVTDASLGDGSGIATWNWDFGDGSTSGVQNPPPHTYVNPGAYNICLNIKTNAGCVSPNYCQTVTATTDQAAYTYNTNGLTAYFADQSITSSGNIISWVWDFGDGSVGNGQSPAHTYAMTGNYNVCLTITNDKNCTNQYCQEIPIAQCQADFLSINRCLSVAFTDESDDGGTGITNWDWDFGDGVGTSTEQNPVYTYQNPGRYNVCLTITTGAGCNNQHCNDDVSVSNANATFTYVDSSLKVNFKDSISDDGSGLESVFWSFGDGDSATKQNPTHIYNTVGTYTVCLTIVCFSGCTYIICHYVTVACPAIQFHFNSTTTDGTTWTFTTDAKGTDANAIYRWNFGDDTTGSGAVVNHTFTTQGIDTVSEDIEDFGCAFGPSDTVINIMVVTGLPGNRALDDIIIFPNPTNTHLNIQLGQIIADKISVFNELGVKVVWVNQRRSGLVKLDVSGLAAGVYNIQINVGNEVSNKSMIIGGH